MTPSMFEYEGVHIPSAAARVNGVSHESALHDLNTNS